MHYVSWARCGVVGLLKRNKAKKKPSLAWVLGPDPIRGLRVVSEEITQWGIAYGYRAADLRRFALREIARSVKAYRGRTP